MNPQLKGCFVEGTFTQRNLGANDMKKIVDEITKISHKAFGEEKDLIGRVYEYFLKEFAVNATKEDGFAPVDGESREGRAEKEGTAHYGADSARSRYLSSVAKERYGGEELCSTGTLSKCGD